MTTWAERGFVAVDWGSSHRRAYALDGGGRATDEMEDDAGALSMARGGFPAAVAVLHDRFGDAPLLMAGMVGSNRGWVEAGYVPCPASLDDIAAQLSWPQPGRAAIVPGLSFSDGDGADVMRGEEVQALGVQALEPGLARATICHPGTHTKWIALDGGRVARFGTVMTGELFSLLRDHSILAELLQGTVVPDAAFLAGVERGFAGAVLGAELFAIRARVLLGVSERDTASSFASGLLIGADLRSGLTDAVADGEILVVGRPSLTALYAAAITRCGHPAREIDGAAAFVAGMRAIAETIA